MQKPHYHFEMKRSNSGFKFSDFVELLASPPLYHIGQNVRSVSGLSGLYLGLVASNLESTTAAESP